MLYEQVPLNLKVRGLTWTVFRYTMGPVFSLVLDTDIKEDLALVYPELYKVQSLVETLDDPFSDFSNSPAGTYQGSITFL